MPSNRVAVQPVGHLAICRYDPRMATDCADLTILDTKAKQALRRRLFAWYAKHERDLPWRKTRDPYHVWVSEIMLQQTQVQTVRAYFQRFMEALPTVEALAAADQQQVLRLWEGLGYYRRARQLHAAAQQLVDDNGGPVPSDVQVPSDIHELQKLPGIGRYTAGAIASIAFGQRVPILEANTIRLLSRLIGYPDDPSKSAGQKILWQTAEELLPRKNLAVFNQALMELGALVCRPTNPACPECPFASHCAAYSEGLQDEIPKAKRKPDFTDLHEVAVVVRKQDRVLVRQCGESERWAGLWDFPRFEADGDSSRQLVDSVRDMTGITCKPGPLLKTIKHGVTRYRITLDCYAAEYASGRVRSSKDQPVHWIRLKEISPLPLSTTGRKIARLM